MKLLNKTTWLYMITFILMIGAGIFLLTFSVTWFIKKDLDKTLQKEKAVIARQLYQLDDIPAFSIYAENEFEIKRVTPGMDTLDVYKDVYLFDKEEEADLPYRQLRFIVGCESETYQVIIRKSMIQTRDLNYSIISSSIILLLLLFGASVIINRWTSQSLWKPFYATLDSLENFDLEHAGKLSFEKADTQEFDQLNSVLTKMTEKIYRDYQSQKEFNENFSHEIQTPLAVIRANLDVLVQTAELNEKEAGNIQSVYYAIDKLIRINKALILLSRIENKQFSQTKHIHINKQLRDTISLFEDQASMKELDIDVSEDEQVHKEINDDLIEILLTNLLQNAIRHSDPGGKIRIQLNSKELRISNIGTEPINPEGLFTRFSKRSNDAGSLGIGLAIVKQICDHYQYKIDYCFEKSWHNFRILY